MKNKIYFITSNEEKIAIANNAINNEALEIVPIKINCPELQDDDVIEIAKASAKYASNILRKDVVTSDKGLFIEALNGFPGPYSAYVEKKLTSKQVLSLLKDNENRNASYRDVLALCKYGKEPIIFLSVTKGTISLEESGENGWNFDRIFIKDGDEKTMANFSKEEMVKKYDNNHWKELIKYLYD